MAEEKNFPEQTSAVNDHNDGVPGHILTQICQPCSKNGKVTTAVVFCSTCNEFQCSECSNAHNKFTFMNNHKLVDASASREEFVVYKMAGLDKCEKHKKLVKFFCKDDEKLCCSTCVIIEHRKCNHVDEIKSMNVQEINGDFALEGEIVKKKERSTAGVKLWTDGEKQMKEQLQNVLGRLTAVRTSMNKKLDDFENSIKDQVTSLSAIKATEYCQHRSKCEETVTTLEHNLEILDAVRRHGTPNQLFIAQQRVKESFVKTGEKASKEMSKLECTEICLELTQTLDSLIYSTEKLGSLRTSTSNMTIDSILVGRPVKLRKIMSVDIQQGEGGTGKPFYSGMDFLPDGRLIAVDIINDECVILSEQLKQLGSYKLPRKPLSVVTVSEDEVVITTGRKMLFHQVSNCNELTHTRFIKTASKYYSICMKDDDHFVVGTYDENKPVRIVSLSGEEKDFNIDFPAKKYLFAKTTCTYIKTSEKVVLTDADEHTVYIYYVKDNISVVVTDEQIKEPRGVTIGPFDSIFVCSRGTNSLVHISQTGQILSSHTLDINYPYRVCVSKDKTKLAVSDSETGGQKLQLFSIDV